MSVCHYTCPCVTLVCRSILLALYHFDNTSTPPLLKYFRISPMLSRYFDCVSVPELKPGFCVHSNVWPKTLFIRTLKLRWGKRKNNQSGIAKKKKGTIIATSPALKPREIENIWFSFALSIGSRHCRKQKLSWKWDYNCNDWQSARYFVFAFFYEL